MCRRSWTLQHADPWALPREGRPADHPTKQKSKEGEVPRVLRLTLWTLELVVHGSEETSRIHTPAARPFPALPRSGELRKEGQQDWTPRLRLALHGREEVLAGQAAVEVAIGRPLERSIDTFSIESLSIHVSLFSPSRPSVAAFLLLPPMSVRPGRSTT